MNPRPRGRYKKKKRDLILYLKITLICYLAIFGVAYMSSDTSANFSSQSVLPGAITAGIWEIPEIPAIACGMEDSTDEVTGEESAPTSEIKATNATEDTVKDAVTGEEVVVDCGDLSDTTEEKAETDKSKEVDCKKTDVSESTEKVTIDCKDEEEEEAAEDTEDAELPAIEKEKEEEEKAAEEIEEIEASADEEEKAEKEKATEEVKTPITEKEKAVDEVKTPIEKEEKEITLENTETPAIEKEKEVKPQNESITEEKAVNKEDGAKTGEDENNESEVKKKKYKSTKKQR